MGISLKYSVNRVSSRGPGLSLLWRSRQRFCLDQLTFWLGWMLRLFSQFSGYLLFAALSGMQEPSLPWIEHGPTRVRWWTQTTDVAPDQKQREHTLNIFFKFESEGIAKNKKSPYVRFWAAPFRLLFWSCCKLLRNTTIPGAYLTKPPSQQKLQTDLNTLIHRATAGPYGSFVWPQLHRSYFWQNACMIQLGIL